MLPSGAVRFGSLSPCPDLPVPRAGSRLPDTLYNSDWLVLFGWFVLNCRAK